MIRVKSMELSRKEAVVLSSFMELLTLSPDRRAKWIEDVLVESENKYFTPERLNHQVRKCIEYQFSWFRNDYLKGFLVDKLNREINITGKEPRLHTCACCGYKTLTRSGWEICNACFWQDDGTAELPEHSSANHMTLAEAKANFEKFGTVSEKFLKSLHPDRFKMFQKNS